MWYPHFLPRLLSRHTTCHSNHPHHVLRVNSFRIKMRGVLSASILLRFCNKICNYSWHELCHSRVCNYSRHKTNFVIPAKAGTYPCTAPKCWLVFKSSRKKYSNLLFFKYFLRIIATLGWVPAFAGMTMFGYNF
jgi:hypothetical protein